MREDDSDEGEPDRIPLSELKADLEARATEEDPPVEIFRGEDSSTGETGEGSTEAETDDDQSVPLSSLRQAVEDRADGPDRSLSAEAFFMEEDVGTVDSEAVWADLLMEEDAEGLLDAFDVEDGGRYQIVTKGLCHRCEYFGDPPELHCTHDGTTIHQAVNMEQYRVSDCPMVEADPTDEPES